MFTATLLNYIILGRYDSQYHSYKILLKCYNTANFTIDDTNLKYKRKGKSELKFD
jgi:hypothetical protein